MTDKIERSETLTYEIVEIKKYAIKFSSTSKNPYMSSMGFGKYLCECNTKEEALKLAELFAGTGYEGK